MALSEHIACLRVERDLSLHEASSKWMCEATELVLAGCFVEHEQHEHFEGLPKHTRVRRFGARGDIR